MWVEVLVALSEAVPGIVQVAAVVEAVGYQAAYVEEGNVVVQQLFFLTF